MSEEKVVETSVGEQAPQATPQGEPPKEFKAPPKLLKVYGREFDISDERGLLQAQTWSEAMSTLVGRQSTEIGELRKFKTDRDQVPKSYDELLKKASELRDEGNHRDADRLLLNFAQEREVSANKKLGLERENDRTWEAYFDSRPEVAKLFGKDKVRQVSEVSLGIYDASNPFQVLDDYWKPKTELLSPPAPKPPIGTLPREEIPPTTLSGGPARPASGAPAPSKVESVDDVLNAFHSGKR
jgi:hypothetical protein